MDSNVQTWFTIAIVFASLASLTYAFNQRGQDVKVVSKLVPPEFAQFAFRLAMERALTTVDLADDEALKTAARELGYSVIEQANGGFTIVVTPTAQTQAARPSTER